MTTLELTLTFIFVWGTILWLLWHSLKIKQLQKKFKELVDIVKENISEPIKKKNIGYSNINFPDWFDLDLGGVWSLDTNGNIVIVQDGHHPHRYDEKRKIWIMLTDEPEIMEEINKN